jgi:hypothetical protein
LVTPRDIVVALVLAAIASREAVASHCHEVSPIVGRERCAQFGDDWAVEPGIYPMFEVAGVFRRMPIHGLDTGGTVSSATTTATYHSHIAPRSAVSAEGVQMQFGARSPHFSLVGEMAVFLVLRGVTSTTQVDGFAPMSTTYAGGGEASLVAGAHTRAGPVYLGVALAGGFHELAFLQRLPSGFSQCHGENGTGCQVVLEQSHAFLEPRLSASVWIDPQASVGATFGRDIVGGGGMIAVTLGIYGAPFGGL